jgi:hypothetical protein
MISVKQKTKSKTNTEMAPSIVQERTVKVVSCEITRSPSWLSKMSPS